MFAINAGRRVAAAAVRSDVSKRGVAAYDDIVCTSPTVRISFPVSAHFIYNVAIKSVLLRPFLKFYS